jgi:hypothetical protein
MGLTIHYELSAPTANLTEAKRLVASLRQRCLDLPFKEIGAVVDLTGEDCDPKSAPKELKWLLTQAQGRKMRETPQGTELLSIPPKRVIAFSTRPGEGCEPANFGLCKHPGQRGWKWASFCKTQFANDPRLGGAVNFLHCHLCVIAALDAARDIGLTVAVDDEGEYWEKRDPKTLAESAGRMDAVIAASVGALKDAGVKAVSPMSGRPDFERLEHEGAASVDPRLIELIRRTAKQG